MKMENPRQMAEVLKQKKNALLLAGQMCLEVEWDGTRLLDHAAALAQALGVPVAATGNTVKGLKELGVERVEKMWVAEVVEFLRSKWLDPVTPARPETLVLLGYSPGVARQLLSAISGVETVVLGPAYIAEASYSAPDLSLKGWREYLEGLAKALRE